MSTSTTAQLSWGVLSTAEIGTVKVIPAIQQSRRGRVLGLASRDRYRAEQAATPLGIERAYGSYEELLADPDIDAIYNPLPNHLHVPWTIRAAAAGKHVLCEKPIALTASEAETLLEVRDRAGVAIQEAFMVRTHPQWVGVRNSIAGGDIGELRAIQGFFSYYNDDPSDIRNQADIGGGGMLDIGCYPVTTSRFVTGSEPTRVVAMVERDPGTGVDRLGSALLDFAGVQASFVYGTQTFPYQRMTFVGAAGRVEVEIPFNAPPDRPCRVLWFRDGAPGAAPEVDDIPVCDQYSVAADAFAAAILDSSPLPVPLEDSVRNMRVLDALLASAQTGAWRAL